MYTFDDCAEEYIKIRPAYPDSLFRWISERAPRKKLLLDCGAGNGQSALGFTEYFDQIIAIDKSSAQISNAPLHPKINYMCMNSENISLPSDSVDLIVSACAVHWFSLNHFYSECYRLLRDDGLVAVWTYSWPTAYDEKLNAVLTKVKNELMPYMPQQTVLHMQQYKSLYFPFKEMDAPLFSTITHWNLSQLISFFYTWPSIGAHIKNTDRLFMHEFHIKLNEAWPITKSAEFTFPLYLRVGTKEGLDHG